MPFSDWDIYTSSPNALVYINPTNPILDTGSLRMDFSGVDSSANVVPSDASGNGHGFSRGKIRTIVRLDDGGGLAPTDEFFVGLTCMQNVDDITGAGQFYAAGLLVSGTHSYVIAKYSAGLVPGAGSFTVLATGTTFEVGEGFTRTIELEWNTDGGIADMTLRRGLATDFSDLADEVSAADFSPYLTALAEGLFAHDFEGAGQKACTFDNTRVFSIAAL